MHNLGQVLYDRETETPVIYCGVERGTICVYRAGAENVEHLGFSLHWWHCFVPYVSRSEGHYIDVGSFVATGNLFYHYFGALDEKRLMQPGTRQLMNEALEMISTTAIPYT